MKNTEVSIFIYVIFLSLVLGLRDFEINFAIDYFVSKNVKRLCLISCEADRYNSWIHKSSLSASKHSIFVSQINIFDSVHFKKLNRCFDQKLVPVGVIINVECEKFKDVAFIASQNKWFDDSHKWLIIDSSSRNLTKHFYASENNQTYNNKTKYCAAKDIYFDEICKEPNNSVLNDSTFINATKLWDNENKIFEKDTKQKDFGKYYDIPQKVVRVLKDLNISVDADITFVNSIENQLILYDVYNYGKELGGNLTIKTMGLWETKTEILKTLKTYNFYRRWDFQQLPIRMAVVTKEPELFNPAALKDNIPAPGIPDVTQNPAISFHVIAEIHNFRFKYNLMITWSTDVRDGNTKVSVNSIHYKQSDLITGLRFTIDKMQFIDFVIPAVFSIETRYFYRIPTTGPGKFENKFLTPLSPTTWLCILGIIPLCALILFQSSRLESRPSSAQFAIFSVIAALCQQFFEDSSDLTVKRNSSARKLTIFVTGLFCVLIYNYYTSSVVSWLLNGPPPSINSLTELLESPLELIYEDVGYTRSWFQVPTFYYDNKNAAVENKLRQKVLQKTQNNSFSYFKSLEEGIDLVKAGGYAYHTEVNNANAEISKKFTQSELCELGSLISMPDIELFAAVQKRSPYREFFNWSLMRLKERGILDCVRLRTTTKPFRCEGSSPRALALGGALPAFLLLAAGYFAAVVILVLERLHARGFPLDKKKNPSQKQIRKFKRMSFKNSDDNSIRYEFGYLD